MIAVEDYLRLVDDALDGMVEMLADLGDDLANSRLDLAGANSPYAILTHCLGVLEYWGGQVVAGRVIVRDRAAEFTASGAVPDLAERTRRAQQQLRADVAALDPLAPPRGRAPAEDAPGLTQGGALLHVYEELAQHRGQLEVTRDVLRAPWARTG